MYKFLPITLITQTQLKYFPLYSIEPRLSPPPPPDCKYYDYDDVVIYYLIMLCMYVCMTPKYLTIRQNKWSAKRIEIKFCSSSSDSRRNCSNQLIIITGVIASLSIPNMHFINSGCMKRKTKTKLKIIIR